MTADGDGDGPEALPSEQTAHFAAQLRDTTSSRHDIPNQAASDAHPRYYPLDVPTPFERYQHRISNRDVMVHRIMTDFMNPSRVPAETYNAYVRHPARFDAFRDKRLRADCRCLQKMLFTSQADTPPPFSVPLQVFENRTCGRPNCSYCSTRYEPTPVHGPRTCPPLMGEQTLDLVRRHFLERDNAIFRAWIAHLAPSSFPTGRGRQRASDPRSLGYQMVKSSDSTPIFTVTVRPDRTPPRPGIKWKEKDRDHLRSIERLMPPRTQLYDGWTFQPYLRRHMDGKGLSGSRRGYSNMPTFGYFKDADVYFTIAWPEENGTMRFIIQPPREFPSREIFSDWKLDLDLNRGRGPRDEHSRRRGTSEPPPNSFTCATIGGDKGVSPTSKVDIIFPRMPLSEIDRRSRRRSLSRRNIHDMFDWNTAAVRQDRSSTTEHGPEINTTQPPVQMCENCRSASHKTASCTRPCGFCGAPNPNRNHLQAFNMIVLGDTTGEEREDLHYIDDERRHDNPHLAPQCPVARQNRCKCMPFPMYHVADRCGVPCRRDCGTKETPGTFQHRNAMQCTARCCMCGLKGHNGKACQLKKCRCGGQHLGQDCSWNPACRKEGCGRYLCGLHCRVCGSTERPFVQWHCGKCAAKAGLEPERDEKRGRSRKKRPRKGQSGNEEQRKGDGATEPVPGDAALTEVTTPAAKEEIPASIFGGPRPPAGIKETTHDK